MENYLQKRIKNRLCVCCKVPLPDCVTTQQCETCATYNRESKAKLREKYIMAGLCSDCGEKTESEKTHCQRCIDANRNNTKKRAEKLFNAGLCTTCGKVPYLETLKDRDLGSVHCEDCYIKRATCKRLGKVTHWETIKQKLYSQDKKCTYTGVNLILGINASLDHIKPQKQHPELTSDPKNIEWIATEVNIMKRDRTPEQFLTLIHAIADYNYNDRLPSTYQS